VPLGCPRGPAGQAVDRVPVGGLGEGKLMLGAAEDVASAVDPVRPRCEQLARARGRQFVGFVASDYRLAAEGQLAQSSAQLGHRGVVVAGFNLILRAG